MLSVGMWAGSECLEPYSIHRSANGATLTAGEGVEKVGGSVQFDGVVRRISRKSGRQGCGRVTSASAGV